MEIMHVIYLLILLLLITVIKTLDENLRNSEYNSLILKF